MEWEEIEFVSRHRLLEFLIFSNTRAAATQATRTFGPRRADAKASHHWSRLISHPIWLARDELSLGYELLAITRYLGTYIGRYYSC